MALPYTGELRGVLTSFGEWLPVRSTFDELHRTLLLGDVGRVYSELAASWLWVRGSAASRCGCCGPVGGAPSARPCWSQFAGGNISQPREAIDWTTPAVSTEIPSAGVATSGQAQQPEDAGFALDVARGAGLDGPVEVVPGTEGEASVVSQVLPSWPTQSDSVAIDPATGVITERIAFADWPIVAKLARWGIDAHMGLLLGVVNQMLLAGLALAVVCLVVWGYRMWWTRRPTAAGRPGLAGPPGSRQQVHPGAALSVGAVAVVVAVGFPVLGISLLVFVAPDIARTTLTRTEQEELRA